MLQVKGACMTNTKWLAIVIVHVNNKVSNVYGY